MIQGQHNRPRSWKEAKKAIRIASLIDESPFVGAYHMAHIRIWKISRTLGFLGFNVDIIQNTNSASFDETVNLRIVPFEKAHWEDYDIIKVMYQKGFETLVRLGLCDHPFIITRLSSVVGKSDAAPGIHFFGEERKWLYEIQGLIARHSRLLSFTTEANRSTWRTEFGNAISTLIVPSAADRNIPRRCINPYSEIAEPIAVYIGNLYTTGQKEVNELWVSRLNRLGQMLKKKGIRLCVIGPGNTRHLNRDAVTYMGPIRNEDIWDYHYFADVGITLAQGSQQNNDSSKIYYYLRAGLPVVSEEPIPNNDLVVTTGHGFVCPYGDDHQMVDMIEAAVFKQWNKDLARDYILRNHTWDHRARIYEKAIKRKLYGNFKS